MNTIDTFKDRLKRLETWIRSLAAEAENDTDVDIFWFEDTKDNKFSIVGGWMRGFPEEFADVLCSSKSDPKYAMCVKIVLNEGPYAYADFETMDMPIDSEGRVDDNCIAIEQDEDFEGMALFFLNELERITKEHTIKE